MPMHKYDLNLREYWRIVKRRKLIIIFTVVVMAIFSFISAILGKPVPIYKTSSTVQVQKTPSQIAYSDWHSSGSANTIETQTHVIKSYLIMELTAKKMGLIPADLSPEEVRQNNKYVNIIIDLQERVQTEQRGNSDLIDITVTANEAKFVTNFCNTLTEVYKTQHTLDLNRKTIESKKFIESQFSIAKDRLTKSEEATKNFREMHKWTTLDSELAYLSGQINRLQDISGQDSLILQKVNAAYKLLSGAENTPLGSNKSFYFDEAPPPYKALNDRLVNLMMERDTLRLTYTDDFPQVKAIKAQIHENVEGMKSQLRAQQKNLSSNLEIYRKNIGELNSRLKAIPEKNMELTRLNRDVDVAKELYILLEKKYQEALIVESEKLEEVKVVKPAIEPLMPTNPPKIATNTILGTILGIILGFVFAFLIETFDTSIGAIEEVEEFLGIHVMGIIPFVSYEEIKTLLGDDPNAGTDEKKLRRYARLAAHFVPSSTLSESYKALRTSLNFICNEKNMKTILFTSSSPGEGKTSIVVNLAITMAQVGQKVLLIDGDLRRPVISKLFGIEQVPGLTDVILGNYEWPKVVRSVADFIAGKMSIEDIMKTPGMDNLNVITSGTFSPNPSEIINSKSIGDFLRQVHEVYDMVLIDAPPVLAATDAALWSSRVDGSVLVYQVGKIARGALKRSKISLENLKADVLGVVLNGLKAEISPDFSQDYYYYYQSSQKEDVPLRKKVKDALVKASADVSSFLKTPFSKGEGKKPADAETPESYIEKFQAEETKQSETETAALAAAPPATERSGRTRRRTRNEAKATPAWLKFMMIGLLVLLLAAGLFYQFGEGQKKKPNRVSLKQQVIGNVAPAAQKKLEPANSGKAPIGKTENDPRPQPVPTPPVSAKPAPPSSVAPGSGKSSVTPASAAAPSVSPKQDTGKPAGTASPIAKPDTAKPVGAVPAKARPDTAKPDKPYSVQVKSVPTSEEAGRIVEELKGKGLDAFSVHVTVKGRGEWNRILIGSFGSITEAEKFLKAHEIERKYPGSIVQKNPGK